jgi:large subunit ribosomal protein L29
MKSADRVKKIRDMSVEELENQVAEMHEQIFHLRFQLAMGQTEALKKMRELRRDNARVRTIIREKAREQ